MAGCRICKREMLTAQGCAIGTVHIGGKEYPRIKAGDIRDFTPYMEDGERCGDCGAMKGFFHHFGCDTEPLMEGKMIHGAHPVLRWMAGNVVVDTDPAGNIKVTKKRSPDKVDGIVAAIMALDRCIRHEENTGSVYDAPDRGLLVF